MQLNSGSALSRASTPEPEITVAEKARLREVHALDPLDDSRWETLLERHPRASMFHTVPWLHALQRTYGYRPMVLTTSPPDAALDNGIILCDVNSWLTGRRLVSLPFADHCEALIDDNSDLRAVLGELEQQLKTVRYIEFRSIRSLVNTPLLLDSPVSYYYHQIDLGPSLDQLFTACHRSSIQRKIRRAERDKIQYEEGRSKTLLSKFYDLLLMTRRRHRVPPQPRAWFNNLATFFGSALKVRLAFNERTPIAAILTIQHKDTLYYKYGGSDERFHNLGGMHLLLWRSIEEAKRHGLKIFDLGRTDWHATGLLIFKDRWGARRSILRYTRLTTSRASNDRLSTDGAGWQKQLIQRVVPYLPNHLLPTLGSLLYKHIG